VSAGMDHQPEQRDGRIDDAEQPSQGEEQGHGCLCARRY
jgi:hypothetical protein